MTNKTEYQLTFSYDYNQTGQVKYDTYLVKSIEKIGGKLVEKYEDDYGSKDIILNVKTDLSTLNKTVKDMLSDLEKKNVKMNVSGNRVQHVINIEQNQFNDFSSFEALAAGWTAERNAIFENQGNSVNIVASSVEQIDEFIKNVLPQASLHTVNNQTPAYFVDLRTEPVISTDNYNKKKVLSI